MELTKFVIIIVLALISISGFILTAINLVIARNKERDERKKNIETAISELRTHTDEEDRKLNEKIERALTTMLNETSTIKQALAEIKAINDLWRDCIKSNITGLLKTAPTDYKKDVLLTEFENNKISLEDAKHLREILLYEKDLPENKSLLWAYTQYLVAIEMEIHELRRVEKNGQHAEIAE